MRATVLSGWCCGCERGWEFGRNFDFGKIHVAEGMRFRFWSLLRIGCFRCKTSTFKNLRAGTKHGQEKYIQKRLHVFLYKRAFF